MHQPTTHAPAPFRFRTTRDDGRVTIVVDGEVDIATAPDLVDELRRAYAAGVETVELDLTPLAFIDVTGVRLLLAARAEAQLSGVALAIRVGPATRRLLQLIDVHDRLAG